MTQKTRYFLIGSGLIVIVGLGTGLVASYGGVLTRPADTAETDLIYLPDDAVAIAFADVRSIMDSSFRQRLRAITPTGAEKDKFLEDTGIDIERDIETVMAGVGPGETQGLQPLVLLRGRFDPDRIEGVATAHGATIEDYRGRRLMLAPAFTGANGTAAGAPPQNGPAMVFLEPGLMAVGQAAALREAIDSADAPSAARNATLMDLVDDVRDTGNAWVVSRVDRLAGSGGLPDAVRTHLPGIEWVVISADVGDGIRGYLRAEAVDEQAGEQLRSVVNGAIAAARVFGGQDPKLETALQSLQTSGSGKSAQLAFTVGPELLDLMKGMAPPAMSAPGPPAQ